MKQPRFNSRTRHKGFTLLEALVALVVISVGLLGILGLQTFALVSTQVSESKTMAMMAAVDLAERIRANPNGMRNGNYNAIAAQAAGTLQPDCTGNVCTAAQMATRDTAEWRDIIRVTLGADARGQANCVAPTAPTTANPCRTFEIAVSWRERSGPETNSVTAVDDRCDAFDDPCFITVFRP